MTANYYFTLLRSVNLFSQIRRAMATNGQRRVAVCQMAVTSDVKDNFAQLKSLVEESKQKGAEFVFLPECCDFVGENRSQTLELSEDFQTGPIFAQYRNLAKSNKIWLSLGGLHERIVAADKMHNCHVIIDDRGDIAATYRKLHLFDVNTPEFKFRESEVVAAGQKIVPPLETPIGKLGLQICYDMRFPEVAVLLRKMGANILTYPSAFAYTTGLAHWETLLRSRAIENQCYVIAAAQIGWHNKKRRSYGHAMIVDPWGKIVAEAPEDHGRAVMVADIDLDQVANVRQNMPCFEHRRDDIYSLAPLSVEVDKRPGAAETFDFGGHAVPRECVFLVTPHSYAFTNIRCVVPGHVLVATKRSVAKLSDLTPEESVDFFQAVMRVQKSLGKCHNATAMTVTVQDGADAGQTVKHVHCHIMPRKKGDFEDNDMIYTELNKHDAPDNRTDRRPLQEMVDEAQWYRDTGF